MEQEVMIRVNPNSDEAVLALYGEVTRLREYAQGMTIASKEDVKLATNDLSMISNLKKAIEEKRKAYVSPINQHLKSVNDAFKGLSEPIDKADNILRSKILEYRKEQQRVQEEQERINRMRLEAAQAEMKLKGEITEPVDLVEVQPEQPTQYRAEAGKLGKRIVAKFEVVDFAQVPDEYKVVDATKVGKVVRAGLRTIPGIRIWEEEALTVMAAKASYAELE